MPKKALNDLAVKRYKPPASGQVDVFDMGYPGFALRVSYGGGKSWVFFYRLGGRQRRLTLGHYPATSLGQARELWRKAREEVAHGRDPARGETTSDNFESIAREWLKRDQAHNRSLPEVERIVNRELIPAWGHRSIKNVGRHDILTLVDGIADRGKITMARRVAAHVHRLFRWSVARGLIESNPAANLPKPGREVKRDRVLTDEELKQVWKAAEAIGWPCGRAIQLLILTGARRAEISELRWSEIDDKAICLNGARTKNGEPHYIPLAKLAKRILDQTPRVAGSEFVFGAKMVGSWPRAKTRLDELSGVTSWRIHDLRRTAATGLQKLGTPLQVTEAILGHTAGSRAGVVGIYQRHDYAKEKRSALEAWGSHVTELVERGAKASLVLR